MNDKIREAFEIMSIGTEDEAVKFGKEYFRTSADRDAFQLAVGFYAGYAARDEEDVWISVDDSLPESEDNSVLVCFENCSIETVHIQDYFDDITAGLDENGKQLYTKLYISVGITHWKPLPEPPKEYRS